MSNVTSRLTANNRDQLRNPTLGNRTRATFTFFLFPLRRIRSIAAGARRDTHPAAAAAAARGVIIGAAASRHCMAPPPPPPCEFGCHGNARCVVARAKSHAVRVELHKDSPPPRPPRPPGTSHCSQIIITRRKPLARRGHDAVLLGRRASGGNKRDKTSERAL